MFRIAEFTNFLVEKYIRQCNAVPHLWWRCVIEWMKQAVGACSLLSLYILHRPTYLFDYTPWCSTAFLICSKISVYLIMHKYAVEMHRVRQKVLCCNDKARAETHRHKGQPSIYLYTLKRPKTIRKKNRVGIGLAQDNTNLVYLD